MAGKGNTSGEQPRIADSMPGSKRGNRFAEAEHAENAGAALLRLAGYFGAEIKLVLLMLLVVLAGTLCGVYAPSMQSKAIDIISGSLAGSLVKTAAVMLAAYLIYSLAQLLQGLLSAKISQNIVGRLRRELFGKIADLPVGYLDTHSHGDVMSRMTNDVENISTVVSQALPSLFSGVLTIIGTAAAMLYFCLPLALLSFITILLTVAATKFLSNRVRKFSRRRQMLLGQLNGTAEEMIAGYRTVVAYNRQEKIVEEFCETADSLTAAGIRTDAFSGVMGPVSNCIGNIGFVIIAVMGGWFSVRGVISVGVISAFIVYAKQFSKPVNELAQIYGQIQTAIAGAERIFAVLDEENEDAHDAARGAAQSESKIDIAAVLNEENEDAYDAARGAAQSTENANARGAAAGETETGGSMAERKESAVLPTAARGNMAGGSVAAAAERKEGAASPASGRNSANKQPEIGFAAARLRGEAAETVTEVVPESAAEAGRAAGSAPAASAPSVSLEHVYFSYVPGQEIIRDFSLTIPAGKSIALVGATGSGKTTIINLLMRFYEADAGQICIGGRDIRSIPRGILRRRIAIVLQDTVLFSGTVRENLSYGRPDASQKDLERAAEMSRCGRMIERLPQGYDTVLTGAGENISQGQRQLLAIARALAADPEILILDEATSNVDTRTEQQIQDALHNVMANRTCIIIAHRLSTIRDADRIVVMDHGRIVESGSHDELLRQQGRYYTLYQTQFAGFAT